MSPLPPVLAVLSSIALLSPAGATSLEQAKVESGRPFLEAAARPAVTGSQAARTSALPISSKTEAPKAPASASPEKKRLDDREPPLPATPLDCIGRLTPRYSMVTTPVGGTLGLIGGAVIAYVAKCPAALGNGISIGVVLGQTAAAGLAARTCELN